jgi:hypothetical protein
LIDKLGCIWYSYSVQLVRSLVSFVQVLLVVESETEVIKKEETRDTTL